MAEGQGFVLEKRNGWTWRRLLPADIFHKTLFSGMIGWDLTRDGENIQAILGHIREETLESIDIAREVDDRATGMFYTRDHTRSGLPWVETGDIYLSSWTFQLKGDALWFSSQHKELGVFGEMGKNILAKWDESERLQREKYGIERAGLGMSNWAAIRYHLLMEGNQ